MTGFVVKSTSGREAVFMARRRKLTPERKDLTKDLPEHLNRKH